MKNFIFTALCAIAVGFAPMASAQSNPTNGDSDAAVTPIFEAEPAGDATLADFKWRNRVIMVFAESPLDPSFSQQIELLSQRPEDLIDRAIVVRTDTDPEARGPIRTKLRPHGFALVIVDMDGRVMLRKSAPWDLREITRAIDKTPLRQQEIRDAKAAARAAATPAGR